MNSNISGFSLSQPLNWEQLAQDLMNKKIETEPKSKKTESIKPIGNLKEEASGKLDMRLKALASLPPEEQQSFLNALNSLKLGSERLSNQFTEETNASISRSSDPKLAAKARLIQRRALHTVKERTIKIDCASLQQEVSFIIKVSNHFNTIPLYVTNEQKAQYREHLARQFEEELIAEEKRKKQHKAKKSTPLKKSKSSPISQSKSVATSRKIDLNAIPPKLEKNVFDPMSKDMVFYEHPRVTLRWLSKSLEDLRNICDIVGGTPVYKYAKMDEESLFFQRSCHFLPGVEEVITFPTPRKSYAFRTDRGYGLIARLSINGKSYEGILYLGIENPLTKEDSRFKLYHRHFKEIDSMQTMFAHPTINDEQLEEDIDGGWEPIGAYSIISLDNDLLKIVFKGESHELIIYPISK